jgi:hypothetical protein
MPALLVPEEEWGEESWGINHPLYVQAQIEHGLEEAQYGYWGFSPSSWWEVAGIRCRSTRHGYPGYTSDLERTTVVRMLTHLVGYCPGAQKP